jgi:hypothetical protein
MTDGSYADQDPRRRLTIITGISSHNRENRPERNDCGPPSGDTAVFARSPICRSSDQRRPNPFQNPQEHERRHGPRFDAGLCVMNM